MLAGRGLRGTNARAENTCGVTHSGCAEHFRKWHAFIRALFSLCAWPQQHFNMPTIAATYSCHLRSCNRRQSMPAQQHIFLEHAVQAGPTAVNLDVHAAFVSSIRGRHLKNVWFFGTEKDNTCDKFCESYIRTPSGYP